MPTPINKNSTIGNADDIPAIAGEGMKQLKESKAEDSYKIKIKFTDLQFSNSSINLTPTLSSTKH